MDIEHKLFNTSDYEILEVLVTRNCTAPMASLTRSQIAGNVDYSSQKIVNTLNSFLLYGVVCEGAKDGRQKTYYVTELGLKNFQHAYGLTDEELKEELYKNE